MNSSDVISAIAMIVSLFAFSIDFFYFRRNFKTERYNDFLHFWIEMDDIFIQHPNIHRYFYDKEYIKKIPDNESEKQLAICIAESFREVFQYSEEISLNVDKRYRDSYYKYMHRIQNTAIYRYANELNPIDYEKNYLIGTMNWK